MDPITIGLVTTVVTVAAAWAMKKYVLPLVEKGITAVKNFFHGKKDGEEEVQKKQEEETKNKKETENKTEDKSKTTDHKIIGPHTADAVTHHHGHNHSKEFGSHTHDVIKHKNVDSETTNKNNAMKAGGKC